MFSARCYQKAKNMYENTKRDKAISITMLAITLMALRILGLFELPFPVNATATFPITREIEGRIAPASMAEAVPAYSSTLSVVVRYVKYFEKGI